MNHRYLLETLVLPSLYSYEVSLSSFFDNLQLSGNVNWFSLTPKLLHISPIWIHVTDGKKKVKKSEFILLINNNNNKQMHKKG